ncbi:hypothetical protein AgCh_032410 [Apium graveolens]
MERRPEPNNLHPKETEEKIGSKVQQLTSWKYWDDPAPGNFSVGIDPDISAQAVERIGQSVLKDERIPSDLIILSCEEDYADFVPFLGKGFYATLTESLDAHGRRIDQSQKYSISCI